MNNKQGPALCILGCIILIPINVWGAQPLSEGALATQTGAVNAALPVIIAKAQDDAKKPMIEQQQARQVLGDNYLQQVRLSPYQEQKQNHVIDSKEKKKLEMMALPERADRFTKYDFESKNVHGEVIITVK